MPNAPNEPQPTPWPELREQGQEYADALVAQTLGPGSRERIEHISALPVLALLGLLYEVSHDESAVVIVTAALQRRLIRTGAIHQ